VDWQMYRWIMACLAILIFLLYTWMIGYIWWKKLHGPSFCKTSKGPIYYQDVEMLGVIRRAIIHYMLIMILLLTISGIIAQKFIPF